VAEPGTAADAAPPSERRRPFDRHRAALGGALRQTRESWDALGAYGRFEQIVSLILTGLVSLVVAVALLHLLARVALLVVFGLVDPADQAVFQAIFGMILTVLIALEFNHSILSVLERKQSIVQVRTVVLIALLALVRKFIILDASKTEPLTLLGLAAAILALGAVHWLVRDQDRKDTAESPTTGAA
jgi:uncharacterized membrane protein (DUF373 family)